MSPFLPAFPLYHEDVIEDPLPLRQVGRRRAARAGLDKASGLLQLVVDLRGNRPFLPRGVHRFQTFEESQEWSIRMMARASSRVPPSSKTS